MRHHNTNRKFGRKRDQRKALLRSLADALIMEGRIETTQAKAKTLRPVVERMVTRARRASLADRRLLSARVSSRAAQRLVDDIAPQYKDRPGGYTRITKLAPRSSDGSPRAVIEFVK